jgi:hypothetical protein
VVLRAKLKLYRLLVISSLRVITKIDATPIYVTYLHILLPLHHPAELDCSIIRKLSIFTTLKDPGSYIPLGDRVLSSDGKFKYVNPKTSTSSSTSFWSHSESKPFTAILLMDYAESSDPQSSVFSPEILPSNLIKYQNRADFALLKKLGVKIINRSEYFRSEFLPLVGQLMTQHPIGTETLILYMMGELKSLTAEDSTFPDLLRCTAFLPTHSYTPADALTPVHTPTVSQTPHTPTQTQLPLTHTTHPIKLYKPYELFNPQIPELLALLDPESFPSIRFQKSEILFALQSVGLAETLDWPDVISCARSISLSGGDGTGKRVIGGEKGLLGSTDSETMTVPTKERKALLRGNYLLLFLDKNISRLIGDDKKEKVKPTILSGFRSLFTDKSSDSAPQPEDILRDYIQQLRIIPWVPVIPDTIHPCMPWPTKDSLGGEGIGVGESPRAIALSALAAAVDCRPVSDAWLCSASRRLVDDSFTDSTQGLRSLSLSPQLLQVGCIGRGRVMQCSEEGRVRAGTRHHNHREISTCSFYNAL